MNFNDKLKITAQSWADHIKAVAEREDMDYKKLWSQLVMLINRELDKEKEDESTRNK